MSGYPHLKMTIGEPSLNPDHIALWPNSGTANCTPIPKRVHKEGGLAYMNLIKSGKTPLTLGNESIMCPIVNVAIEKSMGSYKVVARNNKGRSACIFTGPERTATLVLRQVDIVIEALARTDDEMMAAAKAEICRLIECKDVAPPNNRYTVTLAQINARLQDAASRQDMAAMIKAASEMNEFALTVMQTKTNTPW